ncbi:MAG TPA: hypothetical protein VJN95_09935 [Gemmatimonadales bacterium]|nr:hypothetical protein [Gemmatimonadales bacterium]
MGGLLFGLIVVVVFIAKIRELAREQRSIEDSAANRPARRLSTPDIENRPFSLDQVLAEIQKVKDLSEQERGLAPGRSRPVDRKALAERAEARRRALAAERAAGEDARGPMGRTAAVKLESDESPEDEAVAASLPSAPAAEAPAASAAQPAARAKPISIREATIWREILGTPVSLRDE